MGNRIIRGFSRLGVGVAMLTAVFGLAITTAVAVNRYNDVSQLPSILSKIAPDLCFDDLTPGKEHSKEAIACAERMSVTPVGADYSPVVWATIIGLGATASQAPAIEPAGPFLSAKAHWYIFAGRNLRA